MHCKDKVSSWLGLTGQGVYVIALDKIGCSAQSLAFEELTSKYDKVY
jgi:hypothetical protein